MSRYSGIREKYMLDVYVIFEELICGEYVQEVYGICVNVCVWNLCACG